MSINRQLLVATGIAALALAACNVAPGNNKADANPAASLGSGAVAKLARIDMSADTSFLSAEDKQVVDLLNQAAGLMSEIYKRQMTPGYDQLRTAVAGKNDAALLDRFDANFGPWDKLEEDKPFFGSDTKPAGAGFYPVGLTKAQFDSYLAAHPDQKTALTGPYTVVRRDGDKLVAMPYSVAYKQWLEPAAQLLDKAAAITSNPSLKNFLSLRATAFRNDDYYPSELAWMDLKDTPIEVAIGPYETYTDGIYGAKTAFEAFVTVKNPTESAALDVYKSHLKEMEASLPVEDKYKNFKRGFSSPIAVVDQVHGGGDNVPGTQTIAFNLPNDERVREAKGAKKVILKNVLEAKFDRITKPMAELVLIPEQAALVNKKYMTLNTLFHELSHSLGPGSIMVGGRATTVDKELKEQNSGIEESKADMVGVWNVALMMKDGVLPVAEKDQAYATYVTDLFRHMRFGTKEAHARGSAMQYRYLADKGAIVWDASAKHFRIDMARMDGALAALIHDVIKLQGDGDYAGTVAFMNKWSVVDANAQSVIATMAQLPFDIRPTYPDKV